MLSCNNTPVAPGNIHSAAGSTISTTTEKVSNHEEYTASWQAWEKNESCGANEERNIAVARLQDCLQRQGTELDLHALNLSSLPELLPPNIARLDIHHNRLHELPELPDSLIALYVNNNHLTKLPLSLPYSLQIIDLEANQLETIPDTVLNLSHDCCVLMADNPLTKQEIPSPDNKLITPEIYFSADDANMALSE